MSAKIVITKVTGYDCYGYVFSDQLTERELDHLGLSATMELGAEMLEIEGDAETLEFWVYNGNRGLKINVDRDHAAFSIEEYIAFHPLDLEPDTREF